MQKIPRSIPMRAFRGALWAAGLGAAALAGAQAVSSSPGDSHDTKLDTQAELQQYREMLQEGNPADLTVMRGEAMWKEKRGPKSATLEQCDLGKGPGVVKGVYAELPRYFADVDTVMDAESRIVHCMVELQGFDKAEITKKPFSGAGQRATDLEALDAYVTDASRGTPVNLPQNHPKEIASYERGQKIFNYRAGPYDFSCASCHSGEDKRIRLQDLPQLIQPEDAKRAFTTWPAYRVSQGALRTMQWRMNDCFRQQRFPELVYGSQASIDLITFLGVTAKGGKMDAPAIKR